MGLAMVQIETLVINLADSPDRLQAFAAQAAREKMPFERLDAVDMRGKEVSTADQQLSARIYGRALLAGEIGCFHSHMAAFEQFIQGSADVLLLFEDDAELVPGFWPIAQSIAQDMSHAQAPNWSMVCLGNATRRKYAKPLRAYEANGTTTMLERALSYPLKTHCQMVSRHGANMLLRHTNKPSMPVDHLFAHDITRSKTGFSVFPALAHQADASSDIDDRGQRTADSLSLLTRKWPRKWRNRFDAEVSKIQHRTIDANWLAALQREGQ